MTFDESELKLTRYIVTGLTIAFLGFAGCGVSAYEADVRMQQARATIPGYTGCDHHCGSTSVEIEAAK